MSKKIAPTLAHLNLRLPTVAKPPADSAAQTEPPVTPTPVVENHISAAVHASASKTAGSVADLHMRSVGLLTEKALSQELVGQTVDVPVSLCVESRWNARVIRSAADVDTMATWLEEDDQQMPAKGYVREGKVVITDGVTRLRGLRSNGKSTIRVEVEQPPADDMEEYVRSARLNERRKGHTSLDYAIRFRQLLDEGVAIEQSVIADRVERSPAFVSQCLSMLAIPEGVRRYAVEREHACSHNVLYALSQAFKDKDANERFGPDRMIALAEEAIDEIERERLGGKEAEGHVARKFSLPKARATAERSKVTFWGKAGTLRTLPSKGHLDFSIDGLSPDELAELQKRVGEFFKQHAEQPGAAG